MLFFYSVPPNNSCKQSLNKLNTVVFFFFRYIKLSDLVDQMFPPFKTEGLPPSGLIAPDQFSSFTYWRAPLPDIPVDELNENDDKTIDTTASKQQW